MQAFTTFCFGTGESRSMPRKNIISQFSEACASESAVLDGPATLGKEVGPNAIKGAKQIIEWLIKQKTTENNVNLVGFSRGAVTCIRIANELSKHKNALCVRMSELNEEEQELLKKLNSLKINLFANEPVAGLLDKSVMESRVIPDNVANYIAIFQCDEMRRDFKPQDITRAIVVSPTTKVSMLPMYGNHSDNTKIKSDKLDSGAKIAWYSLYNFLTQHGTRFKNNTIPQISRSDGPSMDLPPLSRSMELLTLFSKHHEQRKDYFLSGQVVKLHDGIPLFRRKRSLNNHLNYYVKNSDFFVNQLERELFKITYPQVFNYLFEQNQVDPRFPRAKTHKKHQQEVKNELSILRRTHPELFSRLNSRGVSLDSEQQIKLGEPKGYYCLESCETIQQLFPEMVPESVKKNNHIFQPVSDLEKDVYRLAFRYLREKSELSLFSERTLASSTVALKKNVNDIMNNPLPNQNMLIAAQIVQQKQELILDVLEKQYIKLEKLSHQSQLRLMLENLLNQYGRHYHVQEKTSFLWLMVSKLTFVVLTLIKEVFSFILNLGHIGSGLFGVLGLLIDDFAKRLSHVVGDFSANIALNLIKAPIIGLAELLKGVGYMVKNCFGLKPLAKLVDDGFRTFRDALVLAIESKEVFRPHIPQQN